MRTLIPVAFVVVMLSLAWPSPAYAYLDPGSASLLVQVIVGFFAAVAASLGFYWHKLKSLFRRRADKQ